MKKPEAFVTPVGRTMWASIIEPNTKFDAEGKYMMDMLFEPEQVVEVKASLESLLSSFVEEKKKELKANKSNSYTVAPIFKEAIDQDGNLTGDVMLRSKQYTKTFDGAPQKIRLADSTGKVLHGFNKAVGNGSKVRAKLYPKPYYMASSNTFGISMLINAVQIIDLVEYEAGGGFDSVEGGFKDNTVVEDTLDNTETVDGIAVDF